MKCPPPADVLLKFETTAMLSLKNRRYTLFYKNNLYKKHQAEICPKNKNNIRKKQAEIQQNLKNVISETIEKYVGTTELHCCTKKREHPFSILKVFRPILVRV